jgi:glycosyl transferase family 25
MAFLSSNISGDPVKQKLTVFYINLDERPDRIPHIEAQLKKIDCNYERFPAIKNEIGAIGCALSHRECLLEAKKRGLKDVLIVEDDLEWISENPQQAIDSLKNENFGVAVLGPVFDIDQRATRVNDYFIRDITAQTAVAYLCRSDFFDLLETIYLSSALHLESGHPSEMFANDQLWKLDQRENPNMWAFAYPPLCKQRVGYSSIEKKQVNYDSAYTRSVNIISTPKIQNAR